MKFIIVLFVIGFGMTATACQKVPDRPTCGCDCTRSYK